MDLDGDGTQEVITAAGSGGGPHIRVFTKDGRSLTAGFFAYDQKFKGGVAITVGDVNGDGEIDTGDTFLLKKQVLQISNITL